MKNLDENSTRIADSPSPVESQGIAKMRVYQRPILLCLDELRVASPSKIANLIREAVRRTIHQTRRDSELNEFGDLPIIERAFAEEIARGLLSHPVREPGDDFFVEAVTPNSGAVGDKTTITLHAKPDELHDLVVEYLDDTSTVLGSSDLSITGRTVSTDTSIIQGKTTIPYLDGLPEQANVYIRVAAVWKICTEATGGVKCITIRVRETETTPFEWNIGSPEIVCFEVNQGLSNIVYPGDTFYLGWYARFLDKIDIIRISNHGPDVDFHDDFSSVQSNVQNGLVVGPFSEDYLGDAEYELTASNSHGSVTAVATVRCRSLPEIVCFEANDESPEITVYPGETFYLSWHARHVKSIDIVRISNQGPDVDFHDHFSSVQGNVQNGLVVGPFSEDYLVDAEYELTASNPGGSVSATIKVLLRSMPDLSVHGVEVTQAIQYYRSEEHLTDPKDIQPDNSIPLIDGKEAWVRVYLRSGQDPNFDNGLVRDVAGQVEVYSPSGSPTPIAVLDPIDSSASIPSGSTHPAPNANHVVHARHTHDYQDERADIDSTLNFLIPADAVIAPMIRLNVDVSAKTSGPGTSAAGAVVVPVVCTPQLRIKAVLVECIQPPSTSVGISPPGDEIATIQDLLSYTRAIFPIRDDVDIDVAGTVTIPFNNLNDKKNCDGCCTPNWMWLNAEVAKVAASDGNRPDWLYYGFVPPEAGGRHCSGCSSGPVASGIVTSQVTLAHELGHQLGLLHAPYGNVGNYDANYPAYEPYEPCPTASIGEFGFDVRGPGEVKPPARWVTPTGTHGFRDFMSYANSKWISLWNFWQIYNGVCQKLGNSSSAGGSPKSNIDNESTQFTPCIYLSGMITEDGQFDVRCLFVLETGQVPTKHAVPYTYVVLLDREGELVAKAPLIAMPSYGDGGESTDKHSSKISGITPPIPFHSTVPYKKRAVAIQIQRKGEVVWARKGIKTSKLELTESKSTESNKLNLTWRYESEKKGELETWVRWSEDGGKTWNGLTVGLRESSASLRIDHLPKGEIVYQILTSDGFNTASVTTSPLLR